MDIDKEILISLGELKSDAASARNQRTTIFEKVSVLENNVSSMLSMKDQVEQNTADIKILNGLKNKFYGVCAFVGVVGLAAVGSMFDVFTNVINSLEKLLGIK